MDQMFGPCVNLMIVDRIYEDIHNRNKTSLEEMDWDATNMKPYEAAYERFVEFAKEMNVAQGRAFCKELDQSQKDLPHQLVYNHGHECFD